MTLLNKFLQLSASDRQVLIKSLLLVLAIRLGLRWLPFRMVRQALGKLASQSAAPNAGDPAIMARDVWAVSVVARYVPAATCLTQALATKILLARHGCSATIHIGVKRSERGELQAHAWVESDGRVVIGGSETSLRHYTMLTAVHQEVR